MSASICWSCHSLLRQRLRVRIAYLQRLRRSQSTSTRPSLSWYNDTTAPTSSQLEAAEKFFLTHKPRKLWTATEWRKHNDAADTSLGLIPEVAFLGRSNVGKSSLLNALLLSPALNHVGPRPGKTTTMHAWAVSPTDPKTGGAIKGMKGDMETKCAVLDMPGYGYASHDDWGEEIMSYLRNRKQLKRAFVLVDGRHGLKSGDLTMLRLLRRQGVSTQVVLSKCDRTGTTEGKEVVSKLWSDVQEKVKGPGLGLLGEVLVVGSLGDGRKNDKVHYNNMRGVDEVQWAVLRATGLDEYAMKVALHGIKAANAFAQQVVTEAEPASSNLTNFNNKPTQHQLLTKDETRSQPEPQYKLPPPSQTPFSWPAKLRQPTSRLSEAAAAPPPSAPRVLKPTNAPASLSEMPSNATSYAVNGLIDLVPPQKPTAERTPLGEKMLLAFSNARSEHTKAQLVATGRTSVKGRQVTNYREARPALKESKPRETWTGSAVGGMADLEAMMAKTSRRANGGRKPVKTKALPKGRRIADHAEESAQEVLETRTRPKEIWTGSAVGGMADLEAMMARTSTPTNGGRKSVKKRGPPARAKRAMKQW